MIDFNCINDWKSRSLSVNPPGGRWEIMYKMLHFVHKTDSWLDWSWFVKVIFRAHEVSKTCQNLQSTSNMNKTFRSHCCDFATFFILNTILLWFCYLFSFRDNIYIYIIYKFSEKAQTITRVPLSWVKAAHHARAIPGTDICLQPEEIFGGKLEKALWTLKIYILCTKNGKHYVASWFFCKNNVNIPISKYSCKNMCKIITFASIYACQHIQLISAIFIHLFLICICQVKSRVRFMYEMLHFVHKF